MSAIDDLFHCPITCNTPLTTPHFSHTLPQAYKGALYQADITLSMMASVNSTHCLLVTGGCQPLGGYSVWATMPPQAPLFPGLTDPKAVRM